MVRPHTHFHPGLKVFPEKVDLLSRETVLFHLIFDRTKSRGALLEFLFRRGHKSPFRNLDSRWLSCVRGLLRRGGIKCSALLTNFVINLWVLVFAVIGRGMSVCDRAAGWKLGCILLLLNLDWFLTQIAERGICPFRIIPNLFLF
jgi:hypothetical protein